MKVRDLMLAFFSAGMFLLAAQAQDGSAGGSAAAPRTVEELRALAQFQQAHPGALLYREAGQLVRVYGATLQTGQNPVDTAARFVDANSMIFGCPASDLVPMSRLPDARHTQPLMYNHETGTYKFTLVYYSQYRDGLPVFRSDLRLLVRNEPGYPLVLAGSSLQNLGDFGVDPLLAHMQFDPASQADTGMTRFTAPERVIWAGYDGKAAEPTLAVTFVGENDRTDAGYECWRFVCDAATGEVLHKETMIHFVDVTGTVQGLATPGAKANICTDEILFVYPWAKVDIQGGSTVYADANGNFTIPNSGSSAVTVRSYVDGLYFTIDNRAGAEETLTATVTPPGPVNFVHNQANTDMILAQTNIYISGNQCRDWLLYYNPSFPGVSTETGVPTIVNRTDYYCPCNAWSSSSDGSINFCQPGTSGSCTCPNTAWQSVLNHEYGHHCIDFTSSGQGEYGEGMSDCFSMLPVDDPNLGYGFCSNCNAGLRTADNTCQYLASGCSTCGSEIHDCGQLLSGIVWSIRNELTVTEPVNYLSILSDIVVNSILLHTGTAINAQIAIDFLTLDDNDGNIYNGTPHRTEICAGFSAHGIQCPALSVGMTVVPTTGFTATGQTGGPFTPSSINYTVENLGPTSTINYSATKTASWLTLTNATGSLNIGQTATVTVALNANADSLPDGDYFDTVQFVNTTDHVGDTTRQVALRVGINDDCVYAKRACPGQNYTGTTAGMTVDGATSCGTSSGTPDVWYKYTPATAGTAVFSLCTGTSYDAVLSVHSGCPGTSANTLGCDDDGCGTTGGPSKVTLSVTAGTTYLIRVSGWSGATGSYTLNISGPACGSTALDVALPGGAPAVIPPGTPSSFNVQIIDRDETYVPGSGLLHYRFGGGSFLTTPLTSISGNIYQATLPAPVCGQTAQFYVSALGSGGTTVTNPVYAPTEFYSAAVGTLTTIMSDAFETDQGWTIGDTGDDATSGIWSRNVPQATTAQPGEDHTPPPGTMCWVTDYRAGSSAGQYDVDGGKTTVKSPTLNLSGYSQATISYWRWYSNCAGGAPGADVFTVDISSNNGSTWSNLETVGPTGDGTCGGWYYHEYNVPSGMLTSLVKLRFVASDYSTGSLIEAAIDDFKVTSFSCVDPATCSDGIQNQGEERIDCGGPCPPCQCTSDAACSDSDYCNGVETCDAYGHCQPGGDPCPGQLCDAEGCYSCSGHDGDINDDGTIDGADIQGFVEAVLAASTSRGDVCPADFSDNGVVDLGDVGGMVSTLLGL